MVKRQKDKQYQSAREHREYSQIRGGSNASAGGTIRKLPFHCCALSLMPYQNPVCNEDGIVFDNSSLLPFLLQHKKDPVTGKDMTTRDIITLTMDKDEETGKWQCPVLCKPFADHTKIIAIKQNPPGNVANVYSYEAYQELNVKTKNYEDLVSGNKFDKKKDVIILNDPDNVEYNKLRDINTFYHVRNAREIEKQKQSSPNTATNTVRHSVTSNRIMEKINQEKKQKEKDNQAIMTNHNNDSSSSSSKKRSYYYYNFFNEEEDNKASNKRIKILSEDVTGVKYTTGKVSTSLTSTAMDVSRNTDSREVTEEEMLQTLFNVIRKLKKKGYVKLETTLGDILIELHCDIAPRTCMNFLKLCQLGKYDKTIFHRLIPNFMIQGGESETKDKDGDDGGSIWGGAFEDEFDERLKHDSIGIVSMANAGPNTNKRQFFMTFGPCTHLDNKHTVFGNVIKGVEVLKMMEKQPTENKKKNKPINKIEILKTHIVENPIKEAESKEKKRIELNIKAREEETKTKQKQSSSLSKQDKLALSSKQEQQTSSFTDTATNNDTETIPIGRYLNLPSTSTAASTTINSTGMNENNEEYTFASSASSTTTTTKSRLKKPPPKKTTFSNFSGW